MSDNYNQIPISVNTRQINNLINSNIQTEPSSSTNISYAKTLASPHALGNNILNSVVKNNLISSSNVTSNASSNNSSTNNINGNNNKPNGLDLDYLDLNELDSVLSNTSNQKSDNPNINFSSSEDANKRRSYIETNSTISKPHHHHHHRHRYENVLLKDLMQLGIKKEKLEKGLAATGYQNSVDAINWIMKHAKDPILMNDSITSTRDYILVMCPIGRLANQIGTFFQSSKAKCGPNEAHYHHLLPYMKLSPFFKIPDSEVSNLHKAFDSVFNKQPTIDLQEQVQLNKQLKTQQRVIKQVNLDLHVSSQMLLLYPDIDSENLIKEVVSSFNKTVLKHSKISF